VDVRWNRATRVEARDFSCWIQLTSKPRRPQPRSDARRIITEMTPTQSTLADLFHIHQYAPTR